MIKNYIGIFIISLMVLGAIVYGFSGGNSPSEVRKKKLDENRIQSLYTLKYSIENYYYSHQLLPKTLTELSVADKDTKDPETSVSYEYIPKDATSYDLCAVFTTSNLKEPDDVYSSYTKEFKHDKGRVCFNRQIGVIPTYNQSGNIIVATPTPIPQCSGSYCDACKQDQCGVSRLSGGGCYWDYNTSACGALRNGSKNGEACYYDTQCLEGSICIDKVCTPVPSNKAVTGN